MKLLFLLVTLLLNCKNKELFEDYYKEAEQYMSNWTLEQKVGQMFFPRFNDTYKERDINTRYPGGFVLFAYDYENFTQENIVKKMEYIQQLSMNSTHLPLGLSVDEEGGKVNRISTFHRKAGPFPSPLEIYNESGIEGVLNIDKEKIEFLKKFKLNINLAPVADISYNSSDYIYNRTLGCPAEETANYIKKDVEVYLKENFTCCLKHFPGYGNNINTHFDVAYDKRPYTQFQEEDFKTFEAGISVNVPMIMVSHNIVECKDSKYPASISKVWHDILRDELKFSGLILTDDLSMDAIKKYTGDESPAVLAFNAGNDILLTSDYDEHLQAVLEAARNDKISIETINKACRRIIAWKIKNLISKKEDNKNEDNNKNNNNNNNNNNGGGNNSYNTVLIICLVVGGIIFIGIVFYFVSKKYLCRKSNESTKDKQMEDEMGSPIMDSY